MRARFGSSAPDRADSGTYLQARCCEAFWRSIDRSIERIPENRLLVLEMEAPTLAYSTALFATFYDAMVASLPPEFEVSESLEFYSNLALECGAQSDAAGVGGSLQIIGVDKSGEMLDAAKRDWIAVPNVEVEWTLGALGQPGALAGIESVDLALISAGSFHHLTTRAEQLVAMAQVKDSLKPGGLLVLNLFAVDEILFEASSGDHAGADVWHLKDGFWKQVARFPPLLLNSLPDCAIRFSVLNCGPRRRWTRWWTL
jgi:SAM-dependent methyltransferase